MLANDLLLQDRYLIRRQIGRGSMGAIYQATDLRLDADVAVKQIVRRGRQMRQAFAREARLLARLRHPALPKVIDHFSDEAGHFLVMEFIPGDNLALAALKRLEPFAVERVLDWGQQLLRLLAYLHGCQPPIVHGDIKPQNLKLNERGEIVLLDFGLAQQETAWPEPDDGITGYSRHYAPPEQMQGRGADARSDLYALAATLYDLATGVKPPDAVHQRLAALAAGRPDPLQPAHEIEPSIPAAVAAVWQRALALNPEERYASARDMHLTLERAAARRAAVPHNLPAQVTSLVGRRREVGTARRRFLAEGVRLLTLTGPGGVGKTRLALQIAAMLRDDFVDGVFFVPLASLRDPDLLLSTLAHSLDVKESGQKSLREAVEEWLHDRQVLLLLDNFEHLLDAALLVAELLAACPQLTVLVTSREVLHVRGEHEFPIPPLEIPELERQLTAAAALQYTAVQLFVQRVRAAAPGFVLDDENVAAVADICTHLDGLPLAVELAAARVKSLTPGQILDRLAHRFDLLQGGPRDLPARQQALRATLDWSYALLAPAKQALFRRLAVFAGGWTAAAAGAICQPAGDDELEALPPAIADGLASLVDKSLIQRQAGVDEESRYAMLATVQAYAAERLAESGEAKTLKERHAAYYLALAEQAKPELDGADPAEWLDRLELELDNLRSVLQWSDDFQQTETGLRLSGAIWRFWQVRGHSAEARRGLESMLARNDDVPTTARAQALNAAGNLALDQGDLEDAQRRLEEATLLWKRLDNDVGLATALNNLGIVAMSLGNYDQARKYLQTCLSLTQQADLLSRVTGHAFNNLGIISLYQGHYDHAITCFEESIALFQSVADKRASSLPLGNLAHTLYAQGNYAQALNVLEEAMAIKQAVGDKEEIAVALQVYGLIYTEQGNYEEATRYLNEALELCREYGYRHHLGFLLDHLAMVYLYQEDVNHAIALLQESLQLLQAVGDRRGIALVKNDLGLAARIKGSYEQAVSLHQAALALRREIGDENGIVHSLQALAYIANIQGEYLQAREYCKESLVLSLKMSKKPGIACSIERLAATDCPLWPARAARLLAVADSIRAAVGAPLPPIDRPAYERTYRVVRSTLEEDAFAAAWAEGQSMSLEQAVTYALEE